MNRAPIKGRTKYEQAKLSYTIVVDNHGGSSMSGEWVRADIEFLLLGINDNEDASVLVDVPNIRTPFGIGSSLGGP